MNLILKKVSVKAPSTQRDPTVKVSKPTGNKNRI
jgi:hypothetical protein